ncbi:MAG: hypothetical protein PHX58_11715 [Desulfovibrio sp.]|nr:hypothetical protein [Desulfovibrio sp.]
MSDRPRPMPGPHTMSGPRPPRWSRGRPQAPKGPAPHGHGPQHPARTTKRPWPGCLLSGLILLLFLALPAWASPPTKQETSPALGMAVPPDVLQDYERFLKGRDPLQITDFSGPHSRRDVVEVILAQQALDRGGYTGEVELLRAPSYRRMLSELERGRAGLTGNTVWQRDLQNLHPAVLASEQLIADGRFQAGFYVTSDNTRALAVRMAHDFQTLRGVTSQDWKPDWAALNSLCPNVLHVNTWEDMLRVLARGRADVTLAPFSAAPDLGLQTQELRLVPIPGIKIVLQGSRHLAVSGTHPHGPQVLRALNRGLRILKQEGVVERAYRQCGFHNPAVAHWNILP